MQFAPNGAIIVAGITVAPGQIATIAGQVIAVEASYAIIDDSTANPPFATPAPTLVAKQPLGPAPNGGVVHCQK